MWVLAIYDGYLHEQWKPVPSQPCFTVSTMGRIRGSKGKLLNPKPKKIGYVMVPRRHNGKFSYFYVHRMIAETFLGPCPPGCLVDHVNEARTDNRLQNLQYVTHRENIARRFRRRARKDSGQRGERNPHRKTNETDVLELRRLHAEKGLTPKQLGPMFNMSATNASDIINRRLWRHI